MPYDPSIHHCRSIRLKEYDYTQAGAYFVTICAHRRARLFGCIENGAVTLSAYGQIVDRCWGALPRHFSGLTLDAYVLMPDHLHGILVLSGLSFTGDGCSSDQAGDLPMRGTNPGSLGAVMQNFKSISTRKVNQSRGTAGMPCGSATTTSTSFATRVTGIASAPTSPKIR